MTWAQSAFLKHTAWWGKKRQVNRCLSLSIERNITELGLRGNHEYPGNSREGLTKEVTEVGLEGCVGVDHAE